MRCVDRRRSKYRLEVRLPCLKNEGHRAHLKVFLSGIGQDSYHGERCVSMCPVERVAVTTLRGIMRQFAETTVPIATESVDQFDATSQLQSMSISSFWSNFALSKFPIRCSSRHGFVAPWRTDWLPRLSCSSQTSCCLTHSPHSAPTT